MTEETNTEAQQEPTQSSYTKEDWERKKSGFVNQLSELQAELKRVKEAEQVKQQAELAEKEEFKTLYEQTQARLKEIETDSEKKIREYEEKLQGSQIDSKLLESGIANELLREGIKAKFKNSGADDFDVFVSELKGTNPDLFKSVNVSTKNNTVNGSINSSKSKLTPELASEYRQSNDPELRKLSREYYEDLYRGNAQ